MMMKSSKKRLNSLINIYHLKKMMDMDMEKREKKMKISLKMMDTVMVTTKELKYCAFKLD